ncbi:MAG: type II secretion system protein GspE, partial [Syntrophobacteria bacterium]
MIRRKLGQILVDAGLITEDQLVEVLKEQKHKGRKRLGKIIVEKGLVDEGDICQSLAKQLNIPYLKLSDLEIPKEVVNTISRRQAERKLIFPYKKTGRCLHLAMG